MKILRLPACQNTLYRLRKTQHSPGGLAVVVDTIVRGHSAPTDDTGSRGRHECHNGRGRDRSGRGRIHDVFSSNAEHDNECNDVWNPGRHFIPVDDLVTAERYLHPTVSRQEQHDEKRRTRRDIRLTMMIPKVSFRWCGETAARV